MRGNTGSPPPNVRVVDDTLADEFAAYDALPAEIRAALQEATFALSSTLIRQGVDKVGLTPAAFAAEIRKIDDYHAANFRRSIGKWW